MVIVFDLDDTLYPELSYVYSGFQVVAHYLAPLLNKDPVFILKALKEELNTSRKEVFNRFLLKQGKLSQTLIKHCVSVYRGHTPHLTLFPAARACLERLQDFPLYIVTDGNQRVQRKKFMALDLNLYIRHCFFTYAYGLQRSKPSPYCFEKICQLEQIPPTKVLYVADNPQKDFVGIKPLGFQTVRVLTGPYQNWVGEEAYEAAFKIPDLNALNKTFLQQFK